MAKTKKVTFGMLAADMPEVEYTTVTYKGKNKEYNINVKIFLDFEEAMMFVNDIANACANSVNENYRPEVFDFAVKASALAYYAGIEIGEDAGKVYDVIYGTDLYQRVREVINEEQFLALASAARDRVNYDRDNIVSAHTSQINELINKMDEVMRDGNQVIEQLSGDEIKKNLDDLMRMAGTLEGKANNVVELPLKK